jgi:hypothetical protein
LRTLVEEGLHASLDRYERQDPFHLRLVTPHELIEKLIPLIPRPRCRLVRYHGILGPAAKDRAKIVPTPPAPATPDVAGADKASAGESREIDLSKIPRVSRLPWFDNVWFK